jgi:hypothetical protein
MKSLVKKIAELNAKTEAWVAEDPQNRFGGLLSTDLDHWKEYDINTGEELEHYLAVSDVYETTRSVHGYKPNWEVLKGMTLEALELELECLAKASKEKAEFDELEKIQNIKKMNSLISKTIKAGAGNFHTAIRWILEGAEVNRRNIQDVESYLWDAGILGTGLAQRILKIR